MNIGIQEIGPVGEKNFINKNSFPVDTNIDPFRSCLDKENNKTTQGQYRNKNEGLPVLKVVDNSIYQHVDKKSG